MAHTSKASAKKPVSGGPGKNGRTSRASMHKTRIAQLKEMIDNEEYVDEAIRKLAGALTAGLMK